MSRSARPGGRIPRRIEQARDDSWMGDLVAALSLAGVGQGDLVGLMVTTDGALAVTIAGAEWAGPARGCGGCRCEGQAPVDDVVAGDGADAGGPGDQAGHVLGYRGGAPAAVWRVAG